MNNPFEILESRLTNIELLLLDLKHKLHPPLTSQSNKPLSIQEAAEFLTLAVPTIYALVGRREIPFSKIGKRLYFSKVELENWVQAARKQTINEIKAEAVLNSSRKGRCNA